MSNVECGNVNGDLEFGSCEDFPSGIDSYVSKRMLLLHRIWTDHDTEMIHSF